MSLLVVKIQEKSLIFHLKNSVNFKINLIIQIIFIIYFYGHLKINEILSYLDKEYLSKFDKKEKTKYAQTKEFNRDSNTISYYNVEKKKIIKIM